MRKVVIIVGPTCSGKTSLAIQLKEKLAQLSLINGDSVQVYNELNIGSDKLSSEQLKKYPHTMLNQVSIKDYYSVYNYQKDVRNIIDTTSYPLIVGGSGFYIKAVIGDYQFVSEGHNSEELERLLSLPLLEQIEYLKSFDPNINILFNNERKMKRALVSVLNGIKPSENKNEDIDIYDSLIIYLDIDRKVLQDKITKRIIEQLERGFMDEVLNLKPYWSKLSNILGYREMIKLINGEINHETYISEVTKVTMKLAKKQKTWFKNKMNITLVDALDPQLLEKTLVLVKKHFDL